MGLRPSTNRFINWSFPGVTTRSCLLVQGHLDRSLLLLMSDHGARFQNVRATEQGKYEERMPFVAVRLPPSFATKYPEIVENLRANADRLTTPFDLHETLVDVIDFQPKRHHGDGSRDRRAFSLFRPIPANRTCAEAGVEPHWYVCCMSYFELFVREIFFFFR